MSRKAPGKRRAGDRVTVYHDPITRQKVEGTATLVTFAYRDEAAKQERWGVRFDGDDPGPGAPTYSRWIQDD